MVDRERLIGLKRPDVIWSDCGSMALLQGLAVSTVHTRMLTKSIREKDWPLRKQGPSLSYLRDRDAGDRETRQ